MSSEKSVCIYCMKEFVDWSGRSKYCCKECREHDFREKNPNYDKEWRRKKKPVYTKECRYCGKIFETTNSIRIFCSDNCKIKHHNEMRPTTKHEMRKCPVCGKTFHPMQKTGTGRTYCTPECRNKHFNGRRRVPSRAKHWESIKKCKWDGNWWKTLERDKFTCQICGLKRKVSEPTTKKRYVLEVHHKDGTGEKGNKNHNLNNLITYCASHHQLFHTKIKLVEINGEYFIEGEIFRLLNINEVKTKY